MKSSAENAKEALAASLKAIRSLEGKGVNADLQMDAEIARNVMKEEIGEFGEFNQSYDLTDEQRDILLAHGRQDVANAMVVASSCYRRIVKLQKSQRIRERRNSLQKVSASETPTVSPRTSRFPSLLTPTATVRHQNIWDD